MNQKILSLATNIQMESIAQKGEKNDLENYQNSHDPR